MTNDTTSTRKSRAPRIIDQDFHLSPGIAVTTSAAMLERIDAIRVAHDAAKPEARRKLGRSKVIRIALLHYAARVRSTPAPAEFQPPAQYAQQVRISATIDNPKDRALHITLARNHGITFNELILRCLHSFLLDPKALQYLLAREDE